MKHIVSVFALLATQAIACVVPPPAIYRAHQAILDEATSVVLVEVQASTDDPASCKLVTLRHWKATPPERLAIQCRLPRAGDWMTDFDSHRKADFWKERSGRLGVNGDCSVIAPAFAVSKKYVLVLGIQPDLKQFEQVSENHDQWVKYIDEYFFAKVAK